MLSLPIITRRRPVYALSLCLLLAIPALVLAWLARPQFSPLSLSHFDSHQCLTKGAPELPPFRVLTLTSQRAVELAERLCAEPLIRQQFSSVTITWHPRAYLRAEHLIEGSFQLFWNRRHIVEGLTPNADTYYLPIFDTPHYALYWVSRNSPTQLNADYLADKTIAFSEDHQSLSFYLRPMATLAAAGIILGEEQKRFYPGIKGIFDAFYRHEVDIISSSKEALLSFDEPLYFTLMADDVPSGSWFLQRQHYSPELAKKLSEQLTLFNDLFDNSNATPEAGP